MNISIVHAGKISYHLCLFLDLLSSDTARLPYTFDGMALQFLFLVIFSWATVMAEEEGTQMDKRLLLDDSQTVSNQMLSLQREIQTLQTKIAEIDVHQSQIQFLNAQVSQLQQENNALKLQISQGSSNQEVQTLTRKVASLDHELPLLKSKMSEHQLQVQSLNATVFKISQKNSDIEAKVNEVVEKNKNLVQHSGILLLI